MPPDLRIVVAGHVDHGKSTLIARLMQETGMLHPARVAELEAASRARGVQFEWSFALDALQAERDQAVTIESSRAWILWKDRRYVFIDVPGHKEFLRNMMSGASEAESSIVVIDVSEGIQEQTRRQARLLPMLGIAEAVVAINKMDAVAWEAALFEKVRVEAEQLLEACGLEFAGTIPISAREGDNLAHVSRKMPWYTGPTLIEALASLRGAAGSKDAPVRMRIQDVYRLDDRRVAVGRIESGRLRVGDSVILLPSNTETRVRAVERWPDPGEPAAALGESIGVTFADEVYVSRGDLLCNERDRATLDYGFRAVCFWMSETPPAAGEHFELQMGPARSRVTLTGIVHATDSGTFEAAPMDRLPRYAVLDLRFRASTLLPLDEQRAVASTSRFVLLRGTDVAGAGLVTDVLSKNAAPAGEGSHLVLAGERERRYGHRGAVIWLTGLSASGKSTLAMALERRLFQRGAAVYVLDGDIIRSGLNRDLGFSPADRAENIRRIGEVAALFADAGTIVITAFISPLARDRELARRAAGEYFHEVYVRADLATCEQRDPKGLYKRARAGEIAQFTGVSAPYEPPAAPDLLVDTDKLDVTGSLDLLMQYVCGVTGFAPVEGAAHAR